MKTKEHDIDQMIKEALSEEEETYYKQLEEETLPEMFIGLFTGKHAWMVVMTTVIILIATVFTFYCGIKLYNAEDVLEGLRWGGAGFLGLIIISILKIWNWMQMNQNALMRQIKHLEFQLSLLNEKNNVQ
jgi:hypothetical protein